MGVVLRYRGREVTSKDVGAINKLIAQNPDLSRRRLSEKLCKNGIGFSPTEI